MWTTCLIHRCHRPDGCLPCGSTLIQFRAKLGWLERIRVFLTGQVRARATVTLELELVDHEISHGSEHRTHQGLYT